MEKFSQEMSGLKQAMSEVCGDWEAARSRTREEDTLVIQELGDLRRLQRIQEEAFEVETEVKRSTLEFKVRKTRPSIVSWGKANLHG